MVQSRKRNSDVHIARMNGAMKHRQTTKSGIKYMNVQNRVGGRQFFLVSSESLTKQCPRDCHHADSRYFLELYNYDKVQLGAATQMGLRCSCHSTGGWWCSESLLTAQAQSKWTFYTPILEFVGVLVEVTQAECTETYIQGRG